MLLRTVTAMIIALVASVSPSAQEFGKVEIFDINKGYVVKEVQSNPEIQKHAEDFLRGIDALFVKFMPIPEKGFMVRIPLSPSVKVQNQWFNGLVDEVIIIVPENGKPYLMIFEGGSKALLFYFKGDTGALLKELDYVPETPRQGSCSIYGVIV